MIGPHDTKPFLKDIEAFNEALQDYQMSEHAQRVLADSRFVLMSGVAGGGRNTIINRLVEQYNYYFLVSDTTRPPKLRSGVMERDGVNYYFRKEEDVLRDIQNGEFVEAEVIHNQQVSGTSIREVEKANKKGLIAIAEVEFGGANNLVAAKPDAFAIALLPPSYDEWIRRFREREMIHEEEFLNRLETAGKVLRNMLDKPYFKFVINDDIEQCVQAVRSIVEDGKYSDKAHAQGRSIAQEMLEKVDAALAQSGRA